ncbi:MAG: YceI family protein, partial [Tepidisphaeraceae bacterium]
MNHRILSLTLLVAGMLAGSVQAADYQVDPVHTSLIYRIKHLQSSYSYGRFNKVGGTFSYDPAAPEKTAYNMSVESADIDSGNPQRDAHLKSPDFFNAKQF